MGKGKTRGVMTGIREKAALKEKLALLGEDAEADDSAMARFNDRKARAPSTPARAAPPGPGQAAAPAAPPAPGQAAAAPDAPPAPGQAAAAPNNPPAGPVAPAAGAQP